jgi:hypothetical protein
LLKLVSRRPMDGPVEDYAQTLGSDYSAPGNGDRFVRRRRRDAVVCEVFPLVGDGPRLARSVAGVSV